MSLRRTIADRSPAPLEGGVVAYGVVEAAPAELPALRDRPGPASGREIPQRFLRYADEQAVVGLAAVLRAMQSPQLKDARFDDWGTIAASRFPGRIIGAGAFTKFREGGPAAISPHIIAQNSLHSVSGAISVALGMHGPNFGVGGGREVLNEGLLVALSCLTASVSGIWLVLTEWTPEAIPDGQGGTISDAVCRAVALGVVPDFVSGCSLRYTRGRPGATAGLPGSGAHRHASPLAELAALLGNHAESGLPVQWSLPLPWGGAAEVTLKQQRLMKAA